jgi:hypothetical protein
MLTQGHAAGSEGLHRNLVQAETGLAGQGALVALDLRRYKRSVSGRRNGACPLGGTSKTGACTVQGERLHCVCYSRATFGKLCGMMTGQ